METTEISIRLPKDEAEFLEAYAREQGLSVADVIDRFIQQLQDAAGVHPDVRRISGLVPEEVDAQVAYRSHLLRKHG